MERPGAERAPTGLPSGGAERRQLTIMFCDLVGSTQLSTRLDPEDLRELYARYQELATGTVARFGGSTVQMLGDGVVAYFGHPLANEDDAERAIRASAALLRDLGTIGTPDTGPLHARIAIATGDVVIGELIGASYAQRDFAIGQTPNLAARLQAAAPPGGMVVDELTRSLAGDHFVYESLGTLRLKGFEQGVPAWLVGSDRAVESRFKALRGVRRTTFVGRRGELDSLLADWEAACAGAGRTVLVSGEPGIGKSRLAAELASRIPAKGGACLVYQCSAIYSSTPLHPVMTRIAEAAGIASDDPADVRLHKLRANILASDPGNEEAVALFALALGLGAAATMPQLEPSQIRERTFQALIRRLRAVATANPVLLVLEDAQWADATTLELAGRVIELMRGLPAMLLITHRADFVPPWASADRAIRLGRLPPDACREIIVEIGGDRAGNGAGQRIISATDGNPLYVEEVSAMLGGGAADPAPGAGAVPVSLSAALSARLDRLNGGKRVAQFAAVFGREFTDELLGAIWPFPAMELRSGFQKLVDSDIIRPSFGRSDGQWTFKHALVREAAYQSLLRRDRRYLHLEIAGRFERQFPELCALEPEFLAAHLEAANLPAKAVACLRNAADSALKRSAYVEANNHLEHCFRLIGELEPGPARDRAELDVQLLRGAALTATRGYAVPEVDEVYRRCAELGRTVGRPGELYLACLGQWRFAITAAQFARTAALGAELLAIGAAIGEPRARLTADLIVGITGFCRGEFASAREHFRRCLATYEPERDAKLAHQFGQDPVATCLVWSAAEAWIGGRGEEASDLLARAEQVARASEHPFTLVYTLYRVAVVHHLRSDFAAMAPLVAELEGLSEAHGFGYFVPLLKIKAALLATRSGAPDAACAGARAALAAIEASATLLSRNYYLGAIAEIFLHAGHAGEAEAVLGEAERVAAESGELWYGPELRRLRAACALERGDGPAARILLAEAVAMARAMQAPAYAARAGEVLDRLP